MNIHIEHQTAGIINIAEGDLSVYGGQQGAVTSDEHARRAVRELRDALPAVPLTGPRPVRHASRLRKSAKQCVRRDQTNLGSPACSNSSPGCSRWPDH